MSGYRYQPGSSHLVVGPGGGVLTSDGPLALRLWPLIGRGSPIAALLDEALRDGLGRLPDLLLFEIDSGGARVIVRGKRSVRLRLGDGEDVRIDGDAVRTWNEQVLAVPISLSTGPDADHGLPLVAGVVLADGFAWSAGDGSDAAGIGPAPTDAAPVAPVSINKHAAEDPVSPAALAAAFVSAAAAVTPLPAGSSASDIRPEPADVVPTPTPTQTVVPESIPSPSGPAASALPDTRIEPIDDSFEHLFESTVMRSVEDAAVRAADEPASGPGNAEPLVTVGPVVQNSQPERQGDHDGSTIMAGQLAAVLASTGDPVPAPGPARCPTLVLSTGQSVEVDRGVVIGRRPHIDRVSGAEIPHLVTVPSPQQDISRSHVAVRPSGDGFLAIDLGSTNGSIIRRADGAAQVLREGAVSDLQFGDVLDLGDGVTAVLRAPS
ncbi:FHA domain-containing protein [Nakamurella panacisegetis]|uniref:FHA domain-containing protein n=1 Tax=Nakamurella panacisegetis TaxID=1090615 RepID=A0A1H0PBA9_9ACTN|nr:FHA domain-containing protein [Nakamurella panacisegetis]SDP01886.1 FHA domain-containing protein [Nakamurella panacisegetis]